MRKILASVVCVVVVATSLPAQQVAPPALDITKQQPPRAVSYYPSGVPYYSPEKIKELREADRDFHRGLPWGIGLFVAFGAYLIYNRGSLSLRQLIFGTNTRAWAYAGILLVVHVIVWFAYPDHALWQGIASFGENFRGIFSGSRHYSVGDNPFLLLGFLLLITLIFIWYWLQWLARPTLFVAALHFVHVVIPTPFSLLFSVIPPLIADWFVFQRPVHWIRPSAEITAAKAQRISEKRF